MEAVLESYKEKTHELRNRLLFTVMVLAVYIAGKGILLYGVDEGASSYRDAHDILVSMLSGDRFQRTVMALGVMPSINASILVQLVASMRTAEARARLSHRIMNRWTALLTFALSIGFAILQSGQLEYRSDLQSLPLTRIFAGAGTHAFARGVSIVEMVGGAMLIYALCQANADHGIGASLPPILLNILDSVAASIRQYGISGYRAIWFLSVASVIITLVMENVTIRIPVQRVSVHNIHASQNYIAYKLNPIGVMPVMLSTAVMSIPQLLLIGLSVLYPHQGTIVSIAKNLTTSQLPGVIVYLCILMVLSLVFPFVMLSPGDTARQLQRNGDSIVGVYAGRKTSRYLAWRLFGLSLLSGAFQCLFMGLSLGLSLQGDIPAELVMMPATAMILVSIGCSLAQEMYAYYRYDSYRFFF